jgi:hypothetical protein
MKHFMQINDTIEQFRFTYRMKHSRCTYLYYILRKYWLVMNFSNLCLVDIRVYRNGKKHTMQKNKPSTVVL